MRLLTTIATTLAQYHQFHATLRELNAHSDRELADMGIDRGDLDPAGVAGGGAPLPAAGGAGDRGYSKTAARSIELAVAGQR